MASADSLTNRQLAVVRASPGKSMFFQPIPDTSTEKRLLATGFAMMCLLTLSILPRMYFLFVGTGFCSPASFTAWITPNQLAAY